MFYVKSAYTQCVYAVAIGKIASVEENRFETAVTLANFERTLIRKTHFVCSQNIM
jgi:hypothetical protein